MDEVKKVLQERRRGPDKIIKAVWWVVGIGWLLIITAFLITSEAQPKQENFIDRLMKASVRKYWDYQLLQYATAIFAFSCFVCVIGFTLNMLRQRRKTDKISKSIIILFVLSLIGLVLSLTR